MNVEIGTEAAQFPEKEYINGIFLAVAHTDGAKQQQLLAENLGFFRPPPQKIHGIGNPPDTMFRDRLHCKSGPHKNGIRKSSRRTYDHIMGI
jgi:hypothetical protein